MKVKLAVLVALIFTSRAFAIFGVGDIVFDPSAYVQLINMYEQGKGQLQILGSITGLNQQQRDTLNLINTAIGVAKGNIDPKNLTLNQITALSQGLGVDAKGEISKIYQQSGPFAGALDIFMGTTLQSFQNDQSLPWQAYERWASNTAMNALGTSVGMNSREVEFASKVALMDDRSRLANKANISVGFSTIASDRYSKGAEQRRISLQAEANLSNQAATRAANATTLNETAAASAELAASQARMQAIAAQQQNAAHETLVIQGDAAGTVLNEMEARRAREEAEKRLAARVQGNGY